MTREEKKRRMERLPRADLRCDYPDSGTHLELDRGDMYLRISRRGKWRKNERFPLWEYDDLCLDDPLALAEFIAALTARYNWLVSGINQAAKEIAAVAPLDTKTL